LLGHDALAMRDQVAEHIEHERLHRLLDSVEPERSRSLVELETTE